MNPQEKQMPDAGKSMAARSWCRILLLVTLLGFVGICARTLLQKGPHWVDVGLGGVQSFPIKQVEKNTSELTGKKITSQTFGGFRVIFGNGGPEHTIVLEIDQDGNAVYIHRYFLVTRHAAFQVTQSEIDAICTALRQSNFARLHDQYDGGWRDCGWLLIQLRFNDETKDVECISHFPDEVAGAMTRIMEVIEAGHASAIEGAEEISEEVLKEAWLPLGPNLETDWQEGREA